MSWFRRKHRYALVQKTNREVEKCRVVEETDSYVKVRGTIGFRDCPALQWQEDRWLKKCSPLIVEIFDA